MRRGRPRPGRFAFEVSKTTDGLEVATRRSGPWPLTMNFRRASRKTRVAITKRRPERVAESLQRWGVGRMDSGALTKVLTYTPIMVKRSRSYKLNDTRLVDAARG